MPPNPLPHTKAWLHYHVAMCRVLLWHMQIYMSEIKILTPYQILYTLLAYMYKLIKDIKYKFKNSHTTSILMLYVLIIACKLINCNFCCTTKIYSYLTRFITSLFTLNFFCALRRRVALEPQPF